jgi:RHS repeat-associated protein
MDAADFVAGSPSPNERLVSLRRYHSKHHRQRREDGFGHGIRQHRVRQSLSSDGTKTVLTIDGWNRTRSATTTNGSQTQATYTADFIGPQLQHVDDNARKQDFTWDGAGRTNSVVMTGAEQPRASQTVYDQAGRVVSSTFGEGTTGSFARAASTNPRSLAIAREFSKVENSYGGTNTELPVTTTSTEDGTHRQTWTLDHNTLGQTTHAGIAGNDFNFDHHFDESGNVTSSKTPARRGETTYDYDARSFNTAEHLPGPSQPTNVYAPDASGVLKQYTDPTGEPTKVTNDGIGRPVLREYYDGTFQEIHYDGTRIDFTRDRQKREQRFAYDDGGRLSEVKNASGVVLDHIDYENGHVIRWKTPDASTEFSDFDVDNHPQQITQHRLDANGNEIDTYTITHSWNGAGELMRTDMPSYQGMNAGARWATRLEFTHDANGNVETILRNGSPLMDAKFRSAGRPVTRNLTLPNGATLGRAYDYDDATGSVGRLSGMRVTVNGTIVTGSSILFEGLQRRSEQLLGVSDGARFTTWTYDDRGRVTGSVVATVDPQAVPFIGIPGASIVKLTDADFRTDLDRTVAGSNDTPSTITTESPRKGHKIGTITHGPNTESILYQGSGGEEVSVRSDDGRYHYDFDEKEHLRAITERLIPNGTQSRLLRVRYAHDAFGRIVGRRVEVSPVTSGRPPLESEWTLAPSDVVGNQPLPAATTFVWDPVTDNLAAIFVEGASRNGTTLANGGLVRQFIHGGMGMDDPIEVVTPDATLFPIFDEPGAGGLQAVIDETGHLLARNLTADPYGEEQLAIAAPAIDEVKLTAIKDASGNLSSVKVTMHATEPLDTATIAAGTRLAAVDTTGAIVRLSTTAPTQPDPYTIGWTLPVAEWTALATSSNAAAISIAAMSSLRSTTYGFQVPILPAPPDMLSSGNVFSSSALPIEIRDSISTVQQQFTTTGTDTPFTVPTVTALGVSNGNLVASLIVSPFQALPFTEPLTGLVNARNRFYEPRTGTFVSPDPLGNIDSGNLYTFAGGDPVNRKDPTGLYEDDIHFYATYYLSRLAGFNKRESFEIAYSTQYVDNDDYTDPVKNSEPLPGRDKRRAAAIHFPTGGRYEVVKENSSMAREAVAAAADTGNLTRLGVSIHTFEDTFAHADFNLEYGSQNHREGSALRPELGHADAYDKGHRPDIPSRDPAKAWRAISATLQLLQASYSVIHGGASPRYHKFDVSIIEIDVAFAIASGALPDRDATYAELKRSRDERVAAWRAIIRFQLGEDVRYQPSGRPDGFTAAVDAHVMQILSHAHK